jgi:hypothetical protein
MKYRSGTEIVDQRKMRGSVLIVLVTLVVLSTLSIDTVTPATAQQNGTPGESTYAGCGQVVSRVVNLTSNLNCSGDGFVVSG